MPMPEIIPAEVLLRSYRHGVFPMAEAGGIEWYRPVNRGLIPLDDRFHVSHGLRRAIRRRPFELRWNTAFSDVMAACAARAETWIDGVILRSYCHLHDLGLAHSVECWDQDGLQGGLYGVALGGAFFGESMFSRKTDASKIALVELVRHLRAAGAVLLDTQWMTPHLLQFGGLTLPRAQYERALATALAVSPRFPYPPAAGMPPT
jgi:leucyl/phenylalanyl-tRNA--protein transferase